MDINPRLHSWTKALPILHKIKRTTTHFVFTQIPLLCYSFCLLTPPWGRCRSHPNTSSQRIIPRTQVLSRMMGNVLLSHVHLVAIQTSCPRSFPEFPLGLAWPMLAGGLEASLALDTGISFHRVPHVRVWPTQATWGFSSHTLVWVKLTIVWCSGPCREVTGLRQKRNHILSISAENI